MLVPKFLLREAKIISGSAALFERAASAKVDTEADSPQWRSHSCERGFTNLAWRLPSLVKSDAAHQVHETRVTAERIKEGVDSDVLQDH